MTTPEEPTRATMAPPERRSRSTLVAYALAALAALVLLTGVAVIAFTVDQRATPPVAIGASLPATTPASKPPPIVAPTLTKGPDDVTYPDAMHLVAALTENGLDCGSATSVPNPTLAVTLVDCGPSVVVGTYADHQDAEDAFTLLVHMTKGTSTSVHMAVGSNWTVSSDDPAYAQRVVHALGGEYLTT